VLGNSAEGHRALVDWLTKSKVPLSEMHVCMEATGVYSEPVALTLHQAGLMVSVVNPACVKGFGHSENIRNKNDAIDAGLIARYCAAMTPAPWNPPPLEQRQLRAWSLRIQALKDIRQQEENRLEALTISGMDEVAQHVRQHIAWLTAEIEKLEGDIDDHINRHPDLKHDADLLATIPGVGMTTVAKILGQLGIFAALTVRKPSLPFLA
jgi:Transposase and inactivated derivatives